MNFNWLCKDRIDTAPSGQTVWGAGIDDDIIVASVKALFSACNRMKK